MAVRILIGCALFIIALIVMYSLASRQLGLLDEQTFCRKDRPLADHTVVLVDRTDPLLDHIADTIFREINTIKDTLPKHAMLSIYQINAESAEVMSPEFCLCNPGNGDDESILYKNPAQIRRRWEEVFGAPLSASLEALRDVARAETSPILEAIGVVGDLPKFREATGVKRIVIYSDMLQNMDWYSHYGSHSLRKPPEEHLRELVHGLDGVDIVIRYIERANSASIQGSRHQELWKEILMGLGARSVEIRRVVG
jgi:hypothetical protein